LNLKAPDSLRPLTASAALIGEQQKGREREEAWRYAAWRYNDRHSVPEPGQAVMENSMVRGIVEFMNISAQISAPMFGE